MIISTEKYKVQNSLFNLMQKKERKKESLRFELNTDILAQQRK